MSFAIGRTFSRTTNLLIQSAASVGVWIFAIHLVSSAFQYFFATRLAAVAAAGVGADPMARLAIFRSGWYWASLAVSLLLGSLSLAGGIGGMIRVGNGESCSPADCLTIGLAKALPVLGLTILWVLGVWLGLILLLVPGLIVLTMWSVTLPVLIAEDSGVGGAFGRSRALTKGSRWKIFALLLIVVAVLYGLFFGVLSQINPGQFGMALAAAPKPLVTAVSAVFATLAAFVIDALVVAIYFELTGARDGSLGEVFA